MLASFVFALATAAAAPSVDPVAAPVAAPAAPAVQASDPNKVICRHEEVTGSRLGNVRVCMTKAQWDERSARDREVLVHSQSVQIPGH